MKKAKEGSELGWNLDSFFTRNSKYISFFPHFHNIPIEHKFRSFISSMFRTKDKAEWSLLHNIEERFTNHGIWWKSSWAFFRNITGFHCNRSYKHHLWSYGIKAFHRLLPLGHILNKGEMICTRH